MKKIARLVLASILGGGLALGGYFLIEKNTQQDSQAQNESKTPKVFQTNYIPSSSTTTLEGTTIDFTKAAEETVHAVVHVKNRSVARKNPLEEFFYGGTNRSQEKAVVGAGSGVIISPDGYIITNNHVIKGADDLEIVLNNQKSYTAEVIGTHERSDIALLKIKASGDLPYVAFGNSDAIKVGEWVLAVGNPFNLTSTVTAGIVSAKARNINGLGPGKIGSFIQTDAAVNPGNSGGALVNIRGELMGINTAITSQTGSYVGYSFAVPSNIAKKVIEDLMEYGDVRTAYIGINYLDLDSKNAKEEFELNGVSEGVLITGLTENGGAKDAGLKVNDIVIKADNIEINRFSELQGYLSTKRPGDVINLTVLRSGSEREFTVKLKNQFDKLSIDKYDFTKYSIGDLKKISKEKATKFKLNYGLEFSGSINEILTRQEVAKGAILLKINETKVYTLDDVENVLRKNKGKRTILQVLNKDGYAEYIQALVRN